MNAPLANYESERAAFRSLLNPVCEKRILLVKGGSGSGKTTLLNSCLSEVPPGLLQVSINLRGSAVSVSEIISRSANRIRWERLPSLRQRAESFASQSAKVSLDDVRQQGEGNSINVALDVQNPADRQERQTALTEAWFADLDRIGTPLLVALDTYEAAVIEVQDWLSGPFLARAADCNQVRVVVAGQNVPDAGIEWGHCCNSHELYGVPEAHQWLPVVESLGKCIPAEHPMDWLAGICHALDGQPAKIIEVIKNLPPSPC